MSARSFPDGINLEWHFLQASQSKGMSPKMVVELSEARAGGMRHASADR